MNDRRVTKKYWGKWNGTIWWELGQIRNFELPTDSQVPFPLLCRVLQSNCWTWQRCAKRWGQSTRQKEQGFLLIKPETKQGLLEDKGDIVIEKKPQNQHFSLLAPKLINYWRQAAMLKNIHKLLQHLPILLSLNPTNLPVKIILALAKGKCWHFSPLFPQLSQQLWHELLFRKQIRL